MSSLYPGLCDGFVGALKDYSVKLHVDFSTHPVVQPHRRIPFHVQRKVEYKLIEIEHDYVIEKVDRLTPI